jgi:hypothetical protein
MIFSLAETEFQVTSKVTSMEQKIRDHIKQTLMNPAIEAYFCQRTGRRIISVVIIPERENYAQKLFTLLDNHRIGYIVQDLLHGRQLSIYLK